MEMLATSTSWINDRSVIAIAALIVNSVLMGPRSFYRRIGLNRPGRLTARLLRTLERKLNRDKRSDEDRAFRGNALVIVFVITMALAGGAVSWLLTFSYYGAAIQILLLAFLLSLRQHADLAGTIRNALEAGDLTRARDELSGTPWRNAPMLDAHGLARAAVETGAVGFTEKVASPILWYVLLGVPGLFVTRMVTALNDAAGEPHDAFGRSIARAGWLVHYVPSLCGGLLICMASMFLPFCRPVEAFKAWALAGFAYVHHRRQIMVAGVALNLSLGGPLSVYAPGPWAGGEVARAGVRDIGRSILLYWVAAFLLLFFLATVLA